MKRNKEDIKNKISFKSKIGIITIKADESGIKELLLSDILNKHVPEYETALYEADCDMMQVQSSGTVSFLLNEAKKQVLEYLAAKRKKFDLKLAPEGTEFQKKVWKALTLIPYGSTKSYADIALMIEKPGAYRAVGMANNKNPISIIIPCHRVIGKDGSLVGYGWGIELKEKLLEFEKNGTWNL